MGCHVLLFISYRASQKVCTFLVGCRGCLLFTHKTSQELCKWLVSYHALCQLRNKLKTKFRVQIWTIWFFQNLRGLWVRLCQFLFSMCHAFNANVIFCLPCVVFYFKHHNCPCKHHRRITFNLIDKNRFVLVLCTLLRLQDSVCFKYNISVDVMVWQYITGNVESSLYWLLD